jgi:tRNA1(Val) A37 N6-methylase TrmN6
MPLTEGHLLGGRVRYAQRIDGFRSGIEPVLLAAAIPAQPGDRVLEGGSGAGAALLCLAARVPDITGIGIELDPGLVCLATGNAQANGFALLRFLPGDVTTIGVRTGGVAGPPPPAEVFEPFDHACANPPYHALAGPRSPDEARDRAKRGSGGLLGAWSVALGKRLRSRGTLTFILPAALLAECLDAFATAGCLATAVLPLWPKPGRDCKLLLVRGVKAGRAPLRLMPGLILHRPAGGFTAETEAILRDGQRLQLE